MTKLYHPSANSFSPSGGEEVTKAEDGSFDVPDEFVPLAIESFGFTDQAPEAPSKRSRKGQDQE